MLADVGAKVARIHFHGCLGLVPGNLEIRRQRRQVSVRNIRDPRSGTYFASVTHGWHGPKIFRTDDPLGEWEQSDGPSFPEGEDDPKTLHVGFLAAAPKNPDLKALENLRKASERFQLVDDVFYLHAPEGIGQSKLAANTERLLGVPMTDRNWRTVCKIQEMAKALI